MTLAQFSLAAQADPKWVQNAAAALGRKLRYTEDEARHLGLVRLLNDTMGIPLRKADELASTALNAGEAREAVVAESADGSIRTLVDVYRYLSTFTAALSRARNFEPRGRGRPARQKGDSAEAARKYGLDLSLIEASLRRTPEERIRLADANAEFVRALQHRVVK